MTRPLVRARAVWILALLPLVTSCAGMASVRGYLVPHAGPRPGRLDQAVVYVESEGTDLDRWFPTRPSRVSLTFAHGTLDPAVSVVKLGTVLEIVNSDGVFHQPFSRSPAAPFEGRSVRPSTSTTVTPRSKGVVQIFCQLHSQESAYVLVLPNGAWTRPDANGAFILPSLPPGRYALHAWHPEMGEQTIPIQVEHSGLLSLELRF